MIVRLNRTRLLKLLNEKFSADEIRNTAKIVNRLPPTAELGEISVALGVIPRDSVQEWRKATKRVPVLIADALAQGIRGHLRAINRTKGTRYAGSKALRIKIVDGAMFGLAISQTMTGMRIVLTMRNRPLPR